MPRGIKFIFKTDGGYLSPDEKHQIGIMLAAGETTGDIARQFHVSRRQIMALNQRQFKVDTVKAFKARVLQRGPRNRLSTTDAFGYWFAGFFDGEGSFKFRMPYGIPSAPRSGGRWLEFKATVLMRADNNESLHYIQDSLGIGSLYLNYHWSDHRTTRKQNPRSIWQCHSLADIVEILCPLFDQYQLWTKKAKEYPLWREAALLAYANTIAGESNRSLIAGWTGEEWERMAKLEVELKRLKRWNG